MQYAVDVVPGAEIDHGEAQGMRHRPEGIDSLCRTTKVTRKELQILYRGFKQVSYNNKIITTMLSKPLDNLTPRCAQSVVTDLLPLGLGVHRGR